MYDFNKLTEMNLIQKISQLTEIEEKRIRNAGIKFTMDHPNAVAKTKAQRWKLELLKAFFREYREALFVEETTYLGSSQKTGDYFICRLAGITDKEKFEVAFLTIQNTLITTKIMFEGTIAETPVYPREIIKDALNYDAASIILAHNHPGGSLKPSALDIDVTVKIKEAVSIFNIKLLDHIIVAGEKYYSFSENNLI